MKLSAFALRRTPRRLRRQGAFLSLVTIALLVGGALPAYASDVHDHTAVQDWAGPILHHSTESSVFFDATGPKKKHDKFVVKQVQAFNVTVEVRCTYFGGGTVKSIQTLNFSVRNTKTLPVDPEGRFEGTNGDSGGGWSMTVHGDFTGDNVDPRKAKGDVEVSPWTVPDSKKCQVVGDDTIQWEAEPTPPPG